VLFTRSRNNRMKPNPGSKRSLSLHKKPNQQSLKTRSLPNKKRPNPRIAKQSTLPKKNRKSAHKTRGALNRSRPSTHRMRQTRHKSKLKKPKKNKPSPRSISNDHSRDNRLQKIAAAGFQRTISGPI